MCGLICLAPTSAHADGLDDVYRGYRPHIVPECKVYEVKPGLEVCGYPTIEEVQALYKADAELFAARQTRINIDLKIKVQAEQVSDLRIAVSALKDAMVVVDARNATLTKELLETDLKYQKERVKPRWGTPLSWGVAGVAGALLVGFVGHSLLIE